MKLSEFIKKLQTLEAEGNGELPVCLSDWGESYRSPNEQAAEVIEVCDGEHWGLGCRRTSKYICIGDE